MSRKIGFNSRLGTESSFGNGKGFGTNIKIPGVTLWPFLSGTGYLSAPALVGEVNQLFSGNDFGAMIFYQKDSAASNSGLWSFGEAGPGFVYNRIQGTNSDIRTWVRNSGNSTIHVQSYTGPFGSTTPEFSLVTHIGSPSKTVTHRSKSTTTISGDIYNHTGLSNNYTDFLIGALFTNSGASQQASGYIFGFAFWRGTTPSGAALTNIVTEFNLVTPLSERIENCLSILVSDMGAGVKLATSFKQGSSPLVGTMPSTVGSFDYVEYS